MRDLNYYVTNSVILGLRTAFWLGVASVPIAIDLVITNFMVEHCMPGSECLAQVMPLIVNIGLINWIAYALLWPLSAWFLGGRWLLAYWRSRLLEKKQA